MKELSFLKFGVHTDLKKVGTYPQIGIVKNFTREQVDSFSRINVESLLEVIPELNSFSFEREAKVTDLISNGYIDTNKGIFINERLKSIIDQYALGNTRYFNAAIKKDGHIYSYFFLFIPESIEYIDFPQSIFDICDVLRRPKETTFKVNSFIELKEKVKELLQNRAGFVIPSYICLKENIDVIRVPFDTRIFISESLKTRLTEEKITGFKVEEPKVKFFID